MSINTVSFTVSPTGISPTSPQAAGVSGDHNATTVTFNVDPMLINVNYRYRIECVDGANIFDTTGNMTIDTNIRVISTAIPNGWTSAGGTATVRLVISELDTDNSELITKYSFDGLLSFTSRSTGANGGEQEIKRGLTALIEDAKEATTEATEAADAAHSAANAAQTEASAAAAAAATATTAAGAAISAAINADNAAASANTAAANAANAAAGANEAISSVDAAADRAQQAANTAMNAVLNADNAADHANTAAERVEDAVSLADSAAFGANTAAANAGNAAADARHAAADILNKAVSGEFDGHGLSVLGLYGSLAELQAARPSGSPGDAYAVGTAAANDLFVWNASESSWQNVGNILGGWTMNDLCIDGGDWTSGIGGWMMDSLCMDAGDWSGTGTVDTLSEHEVDPNTHGNLTIDGSIL